MAQQTGARSPNSPRLPSPPPIAEDQVSPMASPEHQKGDLLASSIDHGASRRIRPGTKAADMHEGPPLVDLSEIDSAFQLTEHLKALHQTYTNPPYLNTTQPVSRSTASLLAAVPPGIDRSIWLYELCRFLVQKINIIIVGLFSDTPACSAATCSEMRASEWQYLCAVHDPPKSCCAIDYCCHTLDWAANTLTSPKHFPSRLSLGADGASHGITRQHQERHLTNIFRRVYRIFAHAWFAHREVFWKVEAKTGLYMLFKTVCDVFNLVESENYTIPPEAEGLDSAENLQSNPGDGPQLPHSILRRDGSDHNGSAGSTGEHENSQVGATARRHRHGLSKSSSIVATVLEENEDEEQQQPPSTAATIPHQEPHHEQSPPEPAVQMAPLAPRKSSPGDVDASAIMMKGDFELAQDLGDGSQDVPQIVEPGMEVNVEFESEISASSEIGSSEGQQSATENIPEELQQTPDESHEGRKTNEEEHEGQLRKEDSGGTEEGQEEERPVIS